jgi:hypothetical protein
VFAFFKGPRRRNGRWRKGVPLDPHDGAIFFPSPLARQWRVRGNKKGAVGAFCLRQSACRSLAVQGQSASHTPWADAAGISGQHVFELFFGDDFDT